MDDRVVVGRFALTSGLQLVISVVLVSVDVVQYQEFLLLVVVETLELDVAMHHEEVVVIAPTFGCLWLCTDECHRQSCGKNSTK